MTVMPNLSYLLFIQEGRVTLLWEFLGYLRECSRKCGTVKEFVECSLESAALPVPSDSGIQYLQREIIHKEVFELGGGETRLASVEGNTDLKVNEENPLRLEIDLADPALAFSGQKASQVNASHFLLLWPPRIMPYSTDSHHVELLGVTGPEGEDETLVGPDKIKKIQQSFGYFPDSNESTSQRIHVQKSLQIKGKTAVVFSHQFMLPFRHDPLLLSRIKPVPGSDQLASLPLNETSILVISAKNCSEEPLLLQSKSIEVDDGVERPCTLEHGGMDILHPAHLVPGEEFKKVFTVIPKVESSCLHLESVSLRWRRNSEMEDLSTSAATQEWVLTKHQLPDVKAELPPLVLNLEFPPYAVLGDPLMYSVKIRNQTRLLQEVKFSLGDAQGFVLSGSHRDTVFVLPKSEHELSYKLVPFASGPHQLP
ncbi:hypothetical protein D5086_003832 [Populus alba]|uniref:Uncharacterized protein n=1 Tax=Populus alba TaxID=43335 RepID=A0ACC4D5F2_POPAL